MNTVEAMETPSLTNLIRTHLDSHDSQFRVALPGIITEYDSITHLAKIQPLIKTSGRDGRTSENMPIISRVPILHPRTAKAAMYLPVAKGDFVTLIFSDRHLESWKVSTGSPIESDTERQHNLSDCWAFLGGYPETQLPAQINKDAFEILVSKTKSTKIAIGNGTEELLSIIHEVVEYIELNITFSNGGGPTGPPTNANLLTAIKTKLENLKV